MIVRVLTIMVIFSLKCAPDLYVGTFSENILIRWAFQKRCAHVFDPRLNIWVWPTDTRPVTFDPKKVRPGDLVFVRSIPLFFRTLHAEIEHPYILITHGEHLDAMQDTYVRYLDDPKLIAWFGIHACQVDNEKFFPIPLGILQEKEHHYKQKKLSTFFAELRATEKNFLAYMNFAFTDKPERKKLFDECKKMKWCKRGTRVPFKEYLKEMAQCKFTLSPAGLAPDCYRNWEALYVGSIPIIKTSALDPLFEGLPVLIIQDWSQITEEFLEKEYLRITAKRYDCSPLNFEFWLEKIENVRQAFFKKKSKEGACAS